MRNNENLNKWNREYYSKHKNDPNYKKKKQESARKYYLKHKTECLKRRKKYFEKNKEKYREYRRVYKYTNPKGIYDTLKLSCKRRTIKLLFKREEFVSWWRAQIQECYYCKRTLKEVLQDNDKTKSKAKRLTIDRKNNNYPYELENIVLACYRCNSTKGDFFTEGEMLKIGKIISDRRIYK